ncbi:MAG: iron chaperone [Anaerolineales bacterium]
MQKFTSIDEYIASFPEATQQKLAELRATIVATAPGIEEKISYDMPTFMFHGRLIYFAAWKKHIALYAVKPTALETYKEEVAPYKGEKGSLAFPLHQPLPLDLIRKLVEIGVAENLKNG